MAIESEKVQKQLVAELKMQKLKELQEKWYTTQTEQGRSKASSGGGGIKKRRRNEKDFLDKLDDEVNIPNNRAQLTDEIDFGSSSDESNDDKYRISSNVRKNQAKVTDDIFGDDSDEVKSIDQNENKIEIETQRKRLKKSTNPDNNNDEDDEFDDVIDNNITKITTIESEGKKKRIIDDDSD